MAWEHVLSLRIKRKVLEIYVDGSRARLVTRRIGDSKVVVEDCEVIRRSRKLDEFLGRLEVEE